MALWYVLQHCFQLPNELISIVQAIHNNSIAAVWAYGKTSEEFSVTSEVCQGCVLAPTLFNFSLDSVLQSTIADLNKQGNGVQVAYHLNTRLVGNRKKMTHEVNVTDLEYADDIALVSSSWDNLTSYEYVQFGCYFSSTGVLLLPQRCDIIVCRLAFAIMSPSSPSTY